MIDIEAFEPQHALEIEAQAMQCGEIDLEEARRHAASGTSYTARIGGRIVLCGGWCIDEDGAAQLWAIVARDAPMLVLHRVAQRFIALFPSLPLFASVRADFPAAGRWLRLLGLQRVGTLPGFANDGADHDVYFRGALQ